MSSLLFPQDPCMVYFVCANFLLDDFSQLMVRLIVGLGWWFGFLESPYERDCYLGVPLESQTTNPKQQLINH